MKISKERQLFDNRALVALIIPLIIEQFLAVLVGMADSIMAVSYTHLDVYKRQVFISAVQPVI